MAADHGFDSTAKPSAVDDGPLAGYAVKDIRDEKVSKGVSGVVGVAITLLVAARCSAGSGSSSGAGTGRARRTQPRRRRDG